MFTGLIEAIGKVLEVKDTDGGKEFLVEAVLEKNDLKIGASIAINGACQTVTELNENRSRFRFYSSYKTLELTNFNSLVPGSEVNLERSLLPDSRMGGHIVQGHVDGVGVVAERYSKDNGNVEVFKIEVPRSLTKYIVERGSITIDGISLTVVGIKGEILELVLIPETLKKTNSGSWKKGVIVNIETDIIARYVEKLNLSSQ